jgi:hypothetical protein
MTDLAVVASIGARVDGLGGIWMGAPVMAVGSALGLEGYPWPFYMVGRGGVLGDVDPDTIAEAMVFPAPELVRSAWANGRELLSVEEGVQRFIGCAYGWAPAAIGAAPNLERAVALLEALATSVDCASAPLAAGWRDVPAPGGLPERAAWAINVLREQRGGIHAACVVAAGLSPVESVMATEGEFMAQMYGWPAPYPDVEASKVRKAPVELATNEAVARTYGALDAGSLAELAGLLEALQSSG